MSAHASYVYHNSSHLDSKIELRLAFRETAQGSFRNPPAIPADVDRLQPATLAQAVNGLTRDAQGFRGVR